MEPAEKPSPPLHLKASLHPFTLLELHLLDISAICADLSKRLQQAPQLLKNAPIVIQLPKQPIDLDWAQQLINALRNLGFIPVGLRIEDQQTPLAEHLNLPIFTDSSQKKSASSKPTNPPVSATPSIAKVVKTVRSGQQLVNPDCATCAVAAQARKPQAFRNHTLPRKGRITMQKDTQNLVAFCVAQLILLGAHFAQNNGVNRLKVAWVRGQGKVDGVVIKSAIRRRAQVIFHIP